MESKSAFITLLGRPNVGKSTLLNALLGQKVSIVSPKPQTTRQRITGILTEGDTQLVFLDTPGVHRAKTKLGAYMDGVAADSTDGADISVLVVESGDEVRDNERRLMRRLAGKTAVLVINKIDARPKEDVLKTIADFSAAHEFAEIIPVSARQKDGTALLKETLKSFARPAPFFYDPEQVTDMNEATMICEMAREKMLYLLGDEVPHGVAVQLTELDKSETLVRAAVTIICERDAHKAIIIGKGGKKLKEIGSALRAELEFTYDCKVFVECFVKVKKDWRNDARALEEFGFRK